MSRSSLHRRLNAHALRPYRHKYFLQISDPLFFEKMEKIIRVYQDQHPFLFCLDECTGLQALERIAPTLPANDKKPVYQEAEYKKARDGLSALHSTGFHRARIYRMYR